MKSVQWLLGFSWIHCITGNNSTNIIYSYDENGNQAEVSFWKESWRVAGFHPIVLTRTDLSKGIDQSESLRKLKRQLDLLQLDQDCTELWHRWLAMSMVGGGRYADVDVWPLEAFDWELPDELTLYDINSPTLAAGPGEAWNHSLSILLDQAMAESTPITPSTMRFWTDSLGVHEWRQDHSDTPGVPRSARRVLVPYSSPRDPVVSQNPMDCQSRPMKRTWVIRGVPLGAHLPPQLRHPRYATQTGKLWLQQWQRVCKERSVE